MKTIIKTKTLCALLGASMGAYAAPVLIPNGDFATPSGANFGFFESAAGVVSFPASGGSVDNGGYGLINNTLGSWGGGLVSPPDNEFPGNQGIPLANLGLSAGETYTFYMDMKNFAGSGTGGLKLEAWNGGAGAFSNTGDMPASGSSSEWATYTWNYEIPAGTTSIKIVPLLTGGSGGSTSDSVGFDNIGVDNTPVVPPPFVPDTIINGDFETPNGAGWGTVQGTPLYPTTGGSPIGGSPDGGYTKLDGTAGFAVLYAFNNTEKTFASLGLAPGDTYTFQMDMRLDVGSSIGGLRLEGPAGYVVEIYPTVIGNGSVWATYEIELTVPSSPGQSKFGLRPGGGSIVSFDNVKIVLPPPPAPLQASIAQGTAVSWTALSAINGYQPQESSDGDTWTNVGPQLVGNTVTSLFDGSTSAFYQVLESVPVVQEAVYNAGFEEDDGFDAEFAEGWDQLGNTGAGDDPLQAPLRVHSVPNPGAHTGDAYMKIKVQNAAVGAQSGKSLIKQNTLNVFDPINGEIIPGNTYTFSFWAKQINVGISYVQQYKVAFLDNGSNILATTGDVNFSAGSEWTQVTHSTGLLAPEGAYFALIEIVGVTGGVDNGAGEVHIDDVSLISNGYGPSTVVVPAPAAVPAVEISWPSKTGQDYQVQSSTDLSGWSNFGGVISGEDDTTQSLYEPISGPKKFYKVGELP